MAYIDSLRQMTAAAEAYEARFPGSLSLEQRGGMARLAIMDDWAQMAADELNAATTEPIPDLRASLKRWQQSSMERRKAG